MNPGLLDATEQMRLFRAKELSPVEALEASLAQIERCEPALNAFCLVDADRALADARRSADRYARGESSGVLDGVPTAIKDVFLTRGWPTLKGSKLVDPDGPWDVDAPVTSALRKHNAVLVGKTTTPEIGWKGVTDSPLCDATRNPWDPALTPGGSSGGSSAAIACGIVPAAPGTDGGGSIRIPAAWCGHAGLKPTFGRVPHAPPSPFGTLAHAGPMAWTVRDVALMLTALTEPDHRDPLASPPDGIAYERALDGDLTGLRVAFSLDLGWVDVDRQIADAVTTAASTLERLGADVERADPGFEDPVETFSVLWYAGAAKALAAFGEGADASVDPGLAEVVIQGRAYTAMEYLEAMARRADLSVAMGAFHEAYDLLVTPTMPIAPFAAGVEIPEGWPHPRWTSWTPFTYPFNLTQQPAASVPCGFTDAGLPIGLQIVGARHADALVLRAAHAYQGAAPLTDRRPPMATEGVEP